VLIPPHAAWTARLDGDVYGEPLVANGMVLAATENDTVYGLDAASGTARWSTHLGSPVPLHDLPCGDIDPLGITSTPVLDPVTNRLFVVAEERAGAGVQHELVAVDASTGTIAFRRIIDPPGMDPTTQQQRSALALSAGNVEIAFGGLDGDCGTYHGWVVAVAEDGSGPLNAFHTAGSQGGIWATGGAVVDGSGHVYVSTGNGGSTGTYDQGDSVLKLTPTARLLDSFAPANWASLNQTDGDLGSAAPILLDNGWLFQLGKDKKGYLLDSNHLGGIGGQKFVGPACTSFGAEAWAPPLLYVECINGNLMALRVNSGPSPSFTTAWTSTVSGAGPPVVGGGAVWTEDWNAGTLSAVDPATGKLLAQASTGTANHFVSPSVTAGLVVVAAHANLKAFTGPGGSPTAVAGYWVAGADGSVAAIGTAPSFGSLHGTRLAAPIVGMAATPDRAGYWLVAADGGIFNFGDARFAGSTGALRLNAPVVGMARTATGHGYWLVARDGGVFSFGDAVFRGSAGSIRLAKPVVGMAATPDGGGYWLVAADGGIFNFGDAGFAGSTGALRLNMVGMTAGPAGRGYWLVAADGGVFNFATPPLGSAGASPHPAPVIGIAGTAKADGYWLAAADGAVLNYGGAAFAGSAVGALPAPAVGIAAGP
jgi:outer membrane protein assembly factor BamB